LKLDLGRIFRKTKAATFRRSRLGKVETLKCVQLTSEIHAQIPSRPQFRANSTG
jgi:hypothetical protein